MPKKSFGKLPPVIKFLLLVVWVITDSSLSCKKFLNLCTNIRIALRLYSIMVHFGEKPFQCITCTWSFTTSDLLINHQGTHSGEVPFECKSCQNWTSQKNDSIQTWTMLHSLGLQSAYVDSQKLGVLKMDVLEVQFDSRNHRCVICVKTFKRPYTLRRHKISMHFGE